MRSGLLCGLAMVALAACVQVPDVVVTAVPRGVAPMARSVDLADLYPVQAGLIARYALKQTRVDGQVVMREMVQQVVEATRDASGVMRATVDRIYGDFRLPATRVRVTASEIRVSRASEPEDGPSLVLLRAPLKKGAHWGGRQFPDRSTEEVEYRGLEDVSGPEGVVRAHRVDHVIRYAQGGSDRLQYWYAPGLGAVRMIERTTVFSARGPLHLSVEGTLQSLRVGDASWAAVTVLPKDRLWPSGGWFFSL